VSLALGIDGLQTNGSQKEVGKGGEGEGTTGTSTPISCGREPPGEVKPGHITLAPPRTNLMAPLSTCIFAIMFGSIAS
jgi:hypothetical protein